MPNLKNLKNWCEHRHQLKRSLRHLLPMLQHHRQLLLLLRLQHLRRLRLLRQLRLRHRLLLQRMTPLQLRWLLSLLLRLHPQVLLVG